MGDFEKLKYKVYKVLRESYRRAGKLFRIQEEMIKSASKGNAVLYCTKRACYMVSKKDNEIKIEKAPFSSSAKISCVGSDKPSGTNLNANIIIDDRWKSDE